MKQTTFASVAWDHKGKVTRRERFLAEMDAVIPWARLLALIEPHYPKAGQGRQPHAAGADAAHLLHAELVQPVRPGGRGRAVRLESMRRFAGIELAEDAVPDESTILRFRHLLERHRADRGDLRRGPQRCWRSAGCC